MSGSKALVIGASGQVGGVLVEQLEAAGVTTCGTYASHKPPEKPAFVSLDITDHEQVEALIQDFKPDQIYLAASYTNVDGCEANPDRSLAVNVLAVRSVVSAAAALSACRLVYFSSDYIFDGVRGPYDEKARPTPVSVYGSHKLEAERIIASSGMSNLILRTTVVYGNEWQKKNFVARLVATLGRGETIDVPDDQIGNPTYNESLAAAAIELCQSYKQGLYNIAGIDRMSRYQFALEAAEIFQLDSQLIKAVKTSSLGQTAKRPLNGGLIMNRARAVLKTELTGVKAGLTRLKETMT